MKRGFTLVEIILSIALITIVGVGSIIGFITYKNYSKEKALNEMDNEILTALRLYMETNEEIKSKVYEDKEGLAVSLQTLQNEGLIDFGNLDITDEDDYVVAFLTAENDCSDISTLKGWDFQDGKPLYICTNSSGGQNLFQVAGDAKNFSQATREPYFLDANNNYARILGISGIGSDIFRILYVDRDDTIVLYSQANGGSANYYAFKSALSTYAKNYVSVSYSTNFYFDTVSFVCQDGKAINFSGGGSGYYQRLEGGIYSTVLPVTYYDNLYYCNGSGIVRGLTSFYNRGVNQVQISPIFTLRLKSNIKITSGTGASDNPFLLQNTSS